MKVKKCRRRMSVRCLATGKTISIEVESERQGHGRAGRRFHFSFDHCVLLSFLLRFAFCLFMNCSRDSENILCSVYGLNCSMKRNFVLTFQHSSVFTLSTLLLFCDFFQLLCLLFFFWISVSVKCGKSRRQAVHWGTLDAFGIDSPWTEVGFICMTFEPMKFVFVCVRVCVGVCCVLNN